jgi:hypothetical protein
MISNVFPIKPPMMLVISVPQPWSVTVQDTIMISPSFQFTLVAQKARTVQTDKNLLSLQVMSIVFSELLKLQTIARARAAR